MCFSLDFTNYDDFEKCYGQLNSKGRMTPDFYDFKVIKTNMSQES